VTISRTSALSRPMLDPGEEAKLLQRVKDTNDLAAETRIVESYYRVCFSTAAAYSKNPADIEELAQEAYFGLRRAIHKYDPSRGTKFSTYIRDWLRSHISAASARTISPISIPPRLYIDAKMNRLDSKKNASALNAVSPVFELDAPIMHEEGSESEQSRLVDTSPNPEEVAISVSSQKHAKSLIALGMEKLTDRERHIITRRRLNEYPDTLEEIGFDLGITRERVRQIEIEAVAKMAALLWSLPGDQRLL
jgi:RNA polymerase sigma-32 factor